MISIRIERILQGLVEDAWRAQRIPSMYAVVADLDRGPTWSCGLAQAPDFERPGDDTQFRIGSITKTLVALQLMKLQEQGRVSLDDCVTDYLPELPLGRRRLRDLLSHTGALREDPGGTWWERATGRRPEDVLTDAVLIDPPTRQYVYSNVGYAVLGDIVARVDGLSWMSSLHREILQPLKMGRTSGSPRSPHVRGWAVHPWSRAVLSEPWGDLDAMAPAGQLWSTADDLLRLAMAVAGRAPHVLSASSAEEMRTVHAVQDPITWDRGYGLGLEIWRTPTGVRVGNFGSIPGFRSAFWIDLDNRRSVVLLANTTADPDLHTLAFAMLDACGPAETQTQEGVRGTSSDTRVITGWWYAGPTHVLVEEVGENLLSVTFGASSPSRFRLENKRWLRKIGDSVIEELTCVAGPDQAPGTSVLRIGSRLLARTPYDSAASTSGGFDIGTWENVHLAHTLADGGQ